MHLQPHPKQLLGPDGDPAKIEAAAKLPDSLRGPTVAAAQALTVAVASVQPDAPHQLAQRPAIDRAGQEGAPGLGEEAARRRVGEVLGQEDEAVGQLGVDGDDLPVELVRFGLGDRQADDDHVGGRRAQAAD